MTADNVNVKVVDNTERSRFEAYVDGDLAGYIEYVPNPGKVIATHTVTEEAYRGRGVASRLVAGALDLLRSDGRLVQPECSYVRRFLSEHAEYRDVVDPTPVDR